MPEDASGAVALRGHAITYVADPFHDDRAFVDIEDALVVMADGVITAFGPYAETRAAVPHDVSITHYPHHLICAGFVDAHIHYAQTGIIGAFGSQLIDWLNQYTFAEEARFRDPAYARSIAKIAFDEMLRNGTTTALSFGTVHPCSVDAFFEESERRGTRMIAGKVLMDRNAPEALLDTAQQAYDETSALISRWHGRGRNLYAITPRFAPTSSPDQLDVAAALWRAHPGTYLQTHVSENPAEVEWVRSLYPERAGYLDVYDHHGLLGPRTMLAHGVHLTDAERERIHEAGAALAHCPTSNLFLGSGLFSTYAAKDRRRPIRLGLGTDIGAGTSFSLLETMSEAYKVAQLDGHPLSAVHLFYLATLGGAEALRLGGTIGSLAVGKEADVAVLDLECSPLTAYRSGRAESTEELMFVMSTMADDQAVAATYVAGRLAYERQPSLDRT